MTDLELLMADALDSLHAALHLCKDDTQDLEFAIDAWRNKTVNAAPARQADIDRLTDVVTDALRQIQETRESRISIRIRLVDGERATFSWLPNKTPQGGDFADMIDRATRTALSTTAETVANDR